MRMSWASSWVTTREEDMAYCLLGISDVKMPLLYGEGMKVFIRLQEEIMTNSDDQSLFADHFETATATRSNHLTRRGEIILTSGPQICWQLHFLCLSILILSSRFQIQYLKHRMQWQTVA
ncbi:hypothetical protein K469DRAFT_384353 [Zopfia rhizophila CBS 207.26]|uniref:Uncharacterized protein n=1 Tax=Zopfia rhizophila CBS 207.26 TaxID=1314779 RepID=A0A6A6EHS6_9PEZI|nr:hypothetical protein K469DRAFT_384353 [Zopfia rhizophila CBS 207.26]